MSNRTYICRTCGVMRRKPAVYWSPRQALSGGPRCHEREMESLTNAQAAGAAKLRKHDRLTWLAHGKRVLRRHAGRWEPVLTDRQATRADAQKATYAAAGTPSQPKPRWVRPRRRRSRPAP